MDKTFTYNEIDEEGLNTLELIAQTNKFNDWIYQSIKPFLKGNILELGSGIGNITSCVMDDKLNITASDIRSNYCEILNKRFAENKYLQAVEQVDITHPNFENEYAHLLNRFDTVFAINIVEHIQDDFLTIENCRKLLRKDGNLIILVPANPSLYNGFDTTLKHYRRYTQTTLAKIFLSAGFKIDKVFSFNFIGILGWWFSGNILRKKSIPEGQMKLFNFLVPVFKFVDKLIGNRIGLSLIAFGKKQDK